MATTHGKNVDVFINEFDLTAFFNNMDLNREAENPETTTFSKNDRTFIAGLKGGNVSLSGFFDSAAGASDEVLNATLGAAADRVVTIGPGGTAIGDVTYLFRTRTSSYNVSGSVDSVVEVTADLLANREIDRGVALHNLTAETVTGDSNATSVDGLGVTTNGGTGHLHVTAVSTPTTLDVDIEDSADDAAWLALTGGTFTQVTTAAISEQITVAAGQAVRQYLSTAWVIVGTSYTFAVAFARR